VFSSTIMVSTAEQNTDETEGRCLSELKLDFDIMSVNAENMSIWERAKIAETLRLAIEKETRKDIENSHRMTEESYEIAPCASQPVYLGVNTSFNAADYRNSGTSKWGISKKVVNSSAATYNNTVQTFAFTYPGVGGCSAWAYVGQKFHIIGQGSQTANIRMVGSYNGTTEALGGGTGNTKITLVVKDLTTGTAYTEEIYDETVSALGVKQVKRTFNSGKSVMLQAGHEYVAYILLEGSGAAVTLGEGGSDFGPWDYGPYDPPNEGARYSRIYIDF